MAAVIMIGCGDAGITATDKAGGDTGSVAFRVVWEGGPNNSLEKHTRALNDCLGVSIVEASIYNDQYLLLAQSEWPCSEHGGTLSAVPAGKNRTLILYGRNSENNIAYYGNRSNIEVVTGTTSRVDNIVATYTVPELLQPSEDAIISSGAVALQWSTIPDAMDYYVVYAEDPDFNTTVDSFFIAGTSYTLTTLSADTTYYWSVRPRYTGIDNEEWDLKTQRQSFSTTAEYTPGDTLPAPEELYTDPADGEIRVTWSAVEGAEGYYLYFRDVASVDMVQTVTPGTSTQIHREGTDTFYVHTDLTNGRVYSHAVSSYNTAGESSLTAQEDLIPAWSNTYQPSLWKKKWVSTILGVNPSVEVNNEDWYVIDVKDDLQIIHVECLFTHADGDIDMQLYDAAGYPGPLAESLDDNETIDHPSDFGGLFYIRVFTNGPTTSYDLQWTTSLNAIAVHSGGSIQAAIDVAENGDTILVADGTYSPSDTDGFDFLGKAITVRSENGPESCIIDGYGNGRGFYFHSGEGASSVVSGFTITGGNINTGLGGGGILCEGASPTISNCIIRNNMVESIAWGGGGISCVYSAAPDITNCVIYSNYAMDADGGGGIYIEDASPTIKNCTIVNNSAEADTGGGIYLFDSSLATIKNSIIWGNSPDQIDNDFATLNITFSNIQDGSQVDGNINVDPLFASDPIYSLSSGSPCIDAGTPPDAPPLDIEGNTRPIGDGYDMGAYEYQ